MSYDAMKKVLEKLPPNYTVATLYVNGAIAPVVNFVTFKDGMAYFINDEGQVSLFNAGKIEVIEFGAVEEADVEEEGA